jgi:hypothetical protein
MMAQRAVTDRAHRYRANQLAPVAGKVCLFCGSTQFLVPDHWDGHPDHTRGENLEVLCKSCNTAKGAAFKTAGRGRLTHQYNPTKGGGAANVGEWMQAVGSITPHVDRGDRGLVSSMSTRDAVDMIRATSQSKRREFAAKMRRRNPGWFSRPDARRTTPAHGGIAHHTGRSRKRADDQNAEFLKSKRGKSKPVGSSAMPDEAALQAGFKRGLSLADMLRANPALRASRKANPAAFDRCVKAVQAKGGAANAYAVCTAAGKRNPATASAEVFEEFHGFEPSEVVTITKKVHHHAHLAALGILVQLDVWGVDGRGHKITGFKGALLACNESRDQLFIEGGDQSVNLADFGIRKPHETETLGRVTNIGYQTNKTHLGDEGGQAVYVHRFRATNQRGKHVMVKMTREPDLIYDVRNEQLLFSGGSYEIIAEGINK